MSSFALIDLSNLFYRCVKGHGKHNDDSDIKIGLALLMLFRSLRKMRRDFQIDHIVFAIDDGSWRYQVYPAYKSRRKLSRLIASPAEQEENTSFLTALNTLTSYLAQQTRCTVLQANNVEGDDFIARWIGRHPHDQHVIISGDSDFIQLMAPNVRIYDALNQRVIALDGIIDDRGLKLAFSVSVKDGKLKTGRPDAKFVPEEDWWRKALFIKLLRGDTGDSVFAAYPGVRYEGKKCSIKAAWEDRKNQGYDWNNLMYQQWDKLLGHTNGEKLTERVRVIDEYRVNQQVIDLTQQPVAIQQTMDACIDAAIQQQPLKHVGIAFLQFCTVHNLPTLAKEADDHVVYLNTGYPKGGLLDDT